MTPAPAMLPCTTQARSSPPPPRSFATGAPDRASGRPPYFTLQCGNVDDVVACVRERLAAMPYGDFVDIWLDKASHGPYARYNIVVSTAAPGMPGGPTHRKIVRDALRTARAALAEAFARGPQP